MKTTFYPTGVCSRQYDIELEDGVIKALEVTGGCNGNLKGISALVAGRNAEEVIPLLRGLSCGNKATSCPDQISCALEQALQAERDLKTPEKTYSSSIRFDMNKEFLFANFPALRAENNPAYGVENAGQVNITSITLDELIYLLNADGTHLILFGGIWSSKTQSVIDQINHYARAHNVDTVYLFDFYADGEDPSTSFKADLTQQADYDGPGKRDVVGCAVCNYLYGELVTRHLTNLNDWVDAKAGSEDDITFLNVYCDPVRVPNLHEPFLFLYNKENTINNSGCGNASGGKYPIVAAMELNYHRRGDGMICDAKGHAVGDLGELLEQGIFRFIGTNGNDLTPYTHNDYMYDAFNLNTRGHSAKSEPAFQKGEATNIQPITLTQLLWMFRQKGTFLFMIGGPWCANSQSAVATLNDYAKANDARVYMFDMRLDSKYAVDFWDYPRQNEYKLSSPYLVHRYVEIWEKYLPGAPILCSIDPNAPAWARSLPIVHYVDPQGNEHNVLSVGVPYIFAYDKDNVGRRGAPKPVVASRHDAGELINCSADYIYHDPMYRNFKGGIYSVVCAFTERVGQEMHDITIDRTAPIVPGTPGINPNIAGKVKYHKEHNWWKERTDQAAAEAKAREAAQTAVEEDRGCC